MSETPTLPITSDPRSDYIKQEIDQIFETRASSEVIQEFESRFTPGEQHTAAVLNGAIERVDSSELQHDTAQWSRVMDRYAHEGITPPTFEPATEVLNLQETDSLDSRLWDKEEYHVPGQAAPRIAEARRPMTYEQTVEASLFPLTDRQLLAYAVANTKAVWALKHLI